MQDIRGPGIEYVTAIAGLNQRAGNRRQLLTRYHRRVKRRLGERYRIDPGLPDEEFIEELTRYIDEEDTTAIRDLLANLTKLHASETEMVRLSAQAASWIDRNSKSTT